MLDTWSTIKNISKKIPDKIFCYHVNDLKTNEISYQMLVQKAHSFAHHLLAKGVKKKDVILITLPHSPELYYCFCAVMAIGAIPAFMPFPNKKQPSKIYWQSHKELFSQINPSLLLTYNAYANELAQQIPSLANKTLIINPPLFENQKTFEPILSSLLEETAFLQHSSGTTNLKKGVMISHQALINQVEAYSKAISLKQNDKIISWLPLYHDMGLITCFLLPLLKGIPIVSLDTFKWSRRPHQLFELIDKHQATLGWLPNFAFHHLVRNYPIKPAWKLNSIRALINCSEPCKAQTFKHFSNITKIPLTKLQVCYALAENVFAVTQTNTLIAAKIISLCPKALKNNDVLPIEKGLDFISCGTIIDGTNVSIINPAKETQNNISVGEILIKGNSIFKGYNTNSSKQKNCFNNGWYATGDMGFMHENQLFVTGRVDDLIISFGKNYYAHDLEYEINHIKGVIPGRCVVLSIYDNVTGTQSIVALIESKEPPALFNELKKNIKQIIHEKSDLTLNKVDILPHGSLLKSSSGKISRSKNKLKFLIEDE